MAGLGQIRSPQPHLNTFLFLSRSSLSLFASVIHIHRSAQQVLTEHFSGGGCSRAQRWRRAGEEVPRSPSSSKSVSPRTASSSTPSTWPSSRSRPSLATSSTRSSRSTESRGWQSAWWFSATTTQQPMHSRWRQLQRNSCACFPVENDSTSRMKDLWETDNPSNIAPAIAHPHPCTMHKVFCLAKVIFDLKNLSQMVNSVTEVTEGCILEVMWSSYWPSPPWRSSHWPPPHHHDDHLQPSHHLYWLSTRSQ